ncbi:MAG: formyltetrahydrofolate deformylase [Acidimicrobiia bacterium]|nr:formyltetrahydrofolate deformylase [Acidimicrobiia bacterium]MDH3398710.1 formyltetrahydrofolate deformylase [Acidimicrobiia bacterium]
MGPTEPATATLLLSCRDQRGLVAAVASFIFEHGGNIIHADQHTDQQESYFLQRVEWQLDGFGLNREEIASAFRPIADRFDMTWRLSFSDRSARIAILVSKQAHCLYDLLARSRMGEVRAEIRVVVSNHPDLESIAADFGVEFHYLPVTPDTRAEQEASLSTLLNRQAIEVVVLARYMQILSPSFVESYANRIINIHHSFLPAFAGAKPYHQAHERGVKVIGATAHYVTGELDAGPIIEQDVARVSHRDNVTDLARKGRDLETIVLARAVHRHLENRIVVYGNKTVVFD